MTLAFSVIPAALTKKKDAFDQGPMQGHTDIAIFFIS